MTSINNAKTVRTNVSCGKLKIIIDLDKHDNPTEIRTILPKTGICKANVGAIADLATVLLENTKVGEVIEALKGHSCPACMLKRKEQQIKGKKEDEEEIQLSCPDAIAKALQEVIKSEKERKD